MKKNQFSSKYYYVMLIVLFGGVTNLFAQAKKNEKVTQKADSTTIVSKEDAEAAKEMKKRNVMLNAGDNTSPRQLNIGLPFAGDILINENGLPVVYSFWTQMPMTTWRYDSSIGRIGLMSFAEGALTFGKVGYIVDSYDRDPSTKFKGAANVYTNSFGSIKYDASISGPIGKNGWGYMLGINESYDHGSGINFQFTPFGNRSEFIKAGISKRYKQGVIKLFYKHAEDRTIYQAYSPLQYDGNGKTSALSNFKLGSDSYLTGDGKFPVYDYNTGGSKMMSLNSDSVSKTVSNTFYLTGEHRFKNNLKLTYSTMYMNSQPNFCIQYPLSLGISETTAQTQITGDVFKYHGTGNVYTGSAQMVAAQLYTSQNVNTSLTKMELTKKLDNQNLRLGFTYQYQDEPLAGYQGIYYQTVEANPKLLDWYMDLKGYGMPGVKAPVTDNNGLIPNSPGKGMGSYSRTITHKAALYFSDDIVVNNWLNGGVGVRIEKENDTENHDPYVNQFIKNRPLSTFKSDAWNKVFTGNVVAKVTKEFGFLADATYNDLYTPYWDYDNKDANGNPVAGALTNVHQNNQVSVMLVGGGIYWNHGELLSVVSKVTHISKNNIVASESAYNTAGQQVTVYPIIYDINTLGWTTDIISSPFKNFNMHFLLTLQNPQYKNYNYTAFGTTYNYSNNLIPELSKTLIEFDPSYFMFNRNVRVWASLRYFGKQNGNPTGAFTYNGWWENFGGVDYNLNRNVTLKLQVVNPLNQTGVKGALVGADQINDASSYVGRKIVAGGIRPRTIELTASFKL
jgi:hypothetical protein